MTQGWDGAGTLEGGAEGRCCPAGGREDAAGCRAHQVQSWKVRFFDIQRWIICAFFFFNSLSFFIHHLIVTAYLPLFHAMGRRIEMKSKQHFPSPMVASLG